MFHRHQTCNNVEDMDPVSLACVARSVIVQVSPSDRL